MPNAKRPGIPAEATKDTANTPGASGQVHDNMAPFSPATKKQVDLEKSMKPSGLPQEGTGRC